MTAEPTTITNLKLSYIRAQSRLLSAPLRTPTSLATSTTNISADQEEVHPLSQKAIEDILDRVNKKIQGHNRLVFSLQSQRHVAEQIDAVYWRDVLGDVEAGFVVDRESTVVRRDADLTVTGTADSLPERWKDVRIQAEGTEDSETPHDGRDSEEERDIKYADLRQRLLDAARRRDELQKRLATYRHVRTLLEPFENAQDNIQPNLVTRDGEIGKELDRMRVLIARVVSQLDQKPLQQPKLSSAEGVDHDVVMTEEQKLANVLGLG